MFSIFTLELYPILQSNVLQFFGLVVEVGGGGSFIVLPVDKTGRVDHNVHKVHIYYRLLVLLFLTVIQCTLRTLKIVLGNYERNE